MHLCSTMWCFDTCKHCIMFKLGRTQMHHLVFVTIYEKNKSFIQFFVLICYSHWSLRCPWFHTDRQELSGCNRGYGVPPTMEKAFQDPPEDACSCSSYRSVWLMHCSHSLTHCVPPSHAVWSVTANLAWLSLFFFTISLGENSFSLPTL